MSFFNFDFFKFFVIMFLGYGGISMEQRKSDINTGDGNVINVDNNGLNYSFDFSSQVAHDSTQGVGPQVNAQAMPEVNAQPGVQVVASNPQPGRQPMPEVNSMPEVNVGPVAMPETTTSGVGPTVGPQVSVSNEVSPMSSPSVPTVSVQNANVQASGVTTPADIQTSTVGVNTVPTDIQASAVQGESTVSDTGVQGEMQNTQQVQDSGEEIIKDKKSTKVFLFVIVAIIVAFIIALPFIRNILG